MVKNETLTVLAVALAMIGLAVGVVALSRNPSVTVNTTQDSRKVVRVQGTGTLDLPPDTATASLGLRVERATAKDAESAAARAMSGVVEAIKGVGVADKDIRTTRLSLQPVFDYNTKGAPRVVAYAVNSTVTVTTQNLGSIGDIIDRAVAAGANEINGVTFTLKDKEKAKQQAIDLALEDARKKAQQVASKTGQEIIGVQSIVVNEVGEPPVYPLRFMKAEEAAGQAAMPVLPGTLTFTVSVEASYILK